MTLDGGKQGSKLKGHGIAIRPVRGHGKTIPGTRNARKRQQ